MLGGSIDRESKNFVALVTAEGEPLKIEMLLMDSILGK